MWSCPDDHSSPDVPAECRFQGAELTGPQRVAAGLDHLRRWTLCLHDDKPLGKSVCGCRGCGPSCRGYSPAESPPPESKAVTVNMGAGGIGDGVQGLCAAALLTHAGNRVVYKVGAKAIPWVSLFAGYHSIGVHEWDRTGRRNLSTREIQLNREYVAGELHVRGRTPRWERYCRAAGVSGPPRWTLRDPAHVRRLGEPFADAVVLCPLSTSGERNWPAARWAELASSLTLRGVRVVVTHHTHAGLDGFSCEKVVGARPDAVAGMLMASRLVVGVDSGMSHVAGAVGGNVIVLTGPTGGGCVFGCYAGATWMAGPLPCNGCYWQHPFDAGCRGGCPSLGSLTCGEVEAAVLARLEAFHG